MKGRFGCILVKVFYQIKLNVFRNHNSVIIPLQFKNTVPTIKSRKKLLNKIETFSIEMRSNFFPVRFTFLLSIFNDLKDSILQIKIQFKIWFYYFNESIKINMIKLQVVVTPARFQWNFEVVCELKVELNDMEILLKN